MHYVDDESDPYGLGEDSLSIYTTVSTDDSVSGNVSAPNDTWAGYDPAACYATSEDLSFSATFLTCVYVMYSTIFVLALLGNGLVCFVVHSSPRMKTVTNYFIVNLAVGDILMTVFCIPFTFVSTLALRYWPFGEVMCKVVNYSQAVSVLVSAYTLLAISIDRYIVIMRPLRPRLGKAHARMVVGAVWVGALATAAPIPVVSEVQRPSAWHQYCEAGVCLENWERPEHSEQYTCALLLLQFALPLCVLVWTYARIAHAVWGGRPPGEAQTQRDSRMQRSKRKMIKMMVAVVVVFTVCWLPLNVFIILWTIHGNEDSWGTWPGMPYVWFASHWLAMSHSCYNPVIYCYMNARYRRGFKHALCCLLRIRYDPNAYRRSTSMCEGLPMSEMVGVNGMTRRGTSSSCASRLHRVPTSTSPSPCPSVRRAHVTVARATATPSPAHAPPPRALSVRTNFH